MAGTLFIVATPIGNLEDITLRALRTLREVDLIAAEDTRRTLKLLSHHHIHCRMVSVHAHNEHREAPKLIAKLLAGASIAFVTDAGTPGISDPGEHLVRLAHERGIKVTPIPGASSVVTALSVSGLPASQFVFMGFAPRKGLDRLVWLQQIAAEDRTVVAFESPHRIAKTLEDLRPVLGERQIQLHRELTKVNEEFVISPNISATMNIQDDTKALGEFVLVIAPAAARDGRDQGGLVAAKAIKLVGCMTINSDFDLDEAFELAAKALEVEPSAIRKAWKKHRILENREREGLS